MARNAITVAKSLALAGLLACAGLPTAHAQNTPAPAPTMSVPKRKPILLGLPTPRTTADGNLVMEPNVRSAAEPTSTTATTPQSAPTAANPSGARQTAYTSTVAPPSIQGNPPTAGPMPTMRGLPRQPGSPAHTETLPPPGATETIPEGAIVYDPLTVGPDAADMAAEVDISNHPIRRLLDHHPIQKALGYFAPRPSPVGDIGLGHEYVAIAPIVVESVQPRNYIKFRFESASGIDHPERSEYFWARPGALGGKGPAAIEDSVSYQEFHAIMEVGEGSLSATTDIPIRVVDPDINLNTAGLGDVSVSTKVVLLKGSVWTIAQVMKTQFNSGDDDRGLGTGNIALEPGFLVRYNWCNEVALHQELKYWFPLPGDPEFAGQVLSYGAALTYVWHETDKWALIPSLEMISKFALDGRQVDFATGAIEAVDPISVVTLHPGLRFVRDTGCDLGVVEWAISAAIPVSSDHWYDGMVRLEVRWSF